MQLKCEQASLLLLANAKPLDLHCVVVTLGLLVDAEDQVMAAGETWAWLTERLGKQMLDRGLKKSRGTFAVQGKAYPLTDVQRGGMGGAGASGGYGKNIACTRAAAMAQRASGLDARCERSTG